MPLTDEALACIKARAHDGALFLDEHYHSIAWAGLISLSRLNLGLCRDCILGQLHGEYATGKRVLGLDGQAAEYYGFTLWSDNLEEWSVLDQAWKEEIHARVKTNTNPTSST